MTFIKNLARDESGASAAEYALILIVVGIAIITGANVLAQSIGGAMGNTAGTISANVGTTGAQTPQTPVTAPAV